MRKALDEAQQAFDEGEIPIGAVVVCQDCIIARAHNLTETLHDVTAHAEMQAITAAANELGEPDTPYCLWLSRREAWLYRLCPTRFASQMYCHRWCTRRRVSPTDARFLQK